ncbi:Holliday junction DNA helicase RuvB [Mycoplasmoides genitalium M6320]|uniref:Holliday junction branch migration complex subunit RuvB n=1 Tax=Mycoplasmoides genitalium M6320 TaxID=662945 RepID=A0ABC7ZJ46_MYCGT|nr:Holliday junction branch migration DNA helicase RuvB [Mycoplasmoides genitalium]AFQ04194.1 Holliday junction DNA helicase RuvB [Mycoplasmoides genitalium M6320]
MKLQIKPPNTFDEFVGKQEIISQIQLSIKASKLNKTQLDHILLYGPPGVGKTTLARLIANELKTKLQIIQGGYLQKPSDFLNAISLIKKGDVLFIDEIHAVAPNVMELMYPVMDVFKIQVLIGKDFNSKIVEMKVNPFTLIGATTQLGKIINPLEDRFGVILNINYYSNAEIEKMVSIYGKQMKLELNSNEISAITEHSKQTPRIAIRIVRRIFEQKIVNKKIDLEGLFKNLMIYKNGLQSIDVQYLEVLNRQNEPQGIKSISSMLGIDRHTIENKIEPFLLRENMIQKTKKGRIITNSGREYLVNF